MTLNLKASELQPGDRFIAPSGPYSGRGVEVVAVGRGRFATYCIECRLVGTVVVELDYDDGVRVTRRAAPAEAHRPGHESEGT